MGEVRSPTPLDLAREWARVRASLLLVLLLLPGAGAVPAERADLIVLFDDASRMPVELPTGAVPLTVLPGFVLLDAPATLEALWRTAPGVARVERAAPLEWHAPDALAAAAEGSAPADLNRRLIRADEADGLTGRGVTVAVVDSGIDTTHPDLAGRVRANVRLVDSRFAPSAGDLQGHGTHVAGIVAADGASSQGRHRGVAPGAALVGLDISERFTTASALLAYDWLHAHREEHGIRVVVNAWGRVDDSPTFDPSDSVVRAIDRLVASGVVVLFSSSNHGPAAGTLSLEAQNPRVVTVGATDAAARVMDYSSRGPVRAAPHVEPWVKPDLVAPGEAVVSLRSAQTAPGENDPDALHRVMSGTSQAVPHVAGLVALMLEANASLTPAQVANALRESAIDLGAPGPDDDYGLGLADVPDALRRARGEPPARDSTLVRGGVERYEDTAPLAPTARRGLLGLAPRAEELHALAFPVKPGAASLTFDVRAGPAGLTSPTVTLERDGRVVGAWTASEDGRVQGRVGAPEPGLWTLRVKGSAPAASDLALAVDVLLPPNPARALELDSRYRLPETGPTTTDADPWRTAFLHARTLARENPGLLPTFSAGAIFALALWPAPRRPRVKRLVVLEEINP